MNINAYLSYYPLGHAQPSSANAALLSQSEKNTSLQTEPITGEFVERQPHSSVTIQQWQHSRIHVEFSDSMSQKAISQYLLTQYAVERENIRQNIGIDTYA